MHGSKARKLTTWHVIRLPFPSGGNGQEALPSVELQLFLSLMRQSCVCLSSGPQRIPQTPLAQAAAPLLKTVVAGAQGASRKHTSPFSPSTSQDLKSRFLSLLITLLRASACGFCCCFEVWQPNRQQSPAWPPVGAEGSGSPPSFLDRTLTSVQPRGHLSSLCSPKALSRWTLSLVWTHRERLRTEVEAPDRSAGWETGRGAGGRESHPHRGLVTMTA